MSRLTQALITSNASANGDLTMGRHAPMLDLTYGGMMGYTPELAEWVSNQTYVRKNLICILIEAPTGFQQLPNPNVWVQTLRSLVELHAQSIEGLNAGLEVEFASNPVGGSGQVQEDFTDVKETVSNVTFRWNEKYGMPVANFFRGWITNLMMDPNSKIANMFTIANAGSAPRDQLSDVTSATMLFIEPDPTFNAVVKSWLVTNMMPKSTGEITGRRDLTQAAEPVTYDIPFTGITQFGNGVDLFAQTILDTISITGANPLNRPAFVSQYTNGTATLATPVANATAGGNFGDPIANGASKNYASNVAADIVADAAAIVADGNQRK
jgi:hypothetical protein